MVDSDTVVRVTMKQLIGTILVLLGGIWGLGFFLFGGVRDDVRDIRTSMQAFQTSTVASMQAFQTSTVASMQALQTSNVDLIMKLQASNGDLGTKIATSNGDLGIQIAALGAKLDAVNASMVTLSSRLDDSKQPSVFLDPKFAATFVEQLKKAGLDDQKIIIVPMSIQR